MLNFRGWQNLFWSLVAVVAVLFPSVLNGQNETTESGDYFRESVAPIFANRCLSCHNERDEAGGFSLQRSDSTLESGFVEPGDVDGSLLMDVITANHAGLAAMPKNGEPLSQAEVQIIAKWVADGAHWPVDFEISDPVVNNFDWWSLQPLRPVAIPTFSNEVHESQWIRNPIDAFILEQLLANQLQVSQLAKRKDLIRRVTYDLTGLPPTPEEVAAFVNDAAPDAYERLVERLLNSPQYGEHWGRHWLDLVRYADTCGYDKDKLRPNAWPYRDYVIRSFNSDKPYSQFVQEQLAGDVLYPQTADGILGLGFIAAGPWDFIGHVEVPESKLDGKEARNLDRDEMVAATMNVFCSTTVQCARCHNHKFDPITQEHYYGMQAVFAAVDRADRVYEVDPELERRRQDLLQQKIVLAGELQQWADEATTIAGPDYAALQDQITKGRAALVPGTLPAEYGYHSQIAQDDGDTKWVEVDLGQEVAISRIVLRACYDQYAGIGAGFGFPEQLRIAIWNGEREGFVTVYDSEAEAMPLPWVAPWEITFADRDLTTQRIRVTATQLAHRSGDFIFALAELEVYDRNGTNLALGANVAALDSIEMPARWSKQNLVDGKWPVYSSAEEERALTNAWHEYRRLERKVNTPERVARRTELQERLAVVEQELTTLPEGKHVYAAAIDFPSEGSFQATRGQPREVRVLHRGNVAQPGERVEPGTILLSADDSPAFVLQPEHAESERRAALARWITDKENPLTWRSIVNRVWLYHFGRGLVDSPNDFGRMGQLPTHPQLLDWLAIEFRDGRQSFKDLHRILVTSATYRQSADHQGTNAQRDADNRYLWRMNRRRLSAEEIRDSVLAVSGRLNSEMGGPGYYLFELSKTEHSPHYEYHLFDPNDIETHRRSVYRFVVRSQPDPLMTTLDCADSSQSVPQRNETLTSLQALALLNNEFTWTMSQHFSQRLMAERTELADQIAWGFELVTGRPPKESEQRELQTYAAEHGLENACRVLLNLSEFVFLD